MVTDCQPRETQSSSDNRILIVDRSDDNREVLRTILQRHGCEIFETNHGVDGLRLARHCQPRVLVLDLETIDPDDIAVCMNYDQQARSTNAAVVVLGRFSSCDWPLADANVLAKPYHYGPLIRKIEALLVEADPAS